MSVPTLKKNCFLVVAHDQPDAGARRAKHVPEHMAYNQPFAESGRIGTSSSIHALELSL